VLVAGGAPVAGRNSGETAVPGAEEGGGGLVGADAEAGARLVELPEHGVPGYTRSISIYVSIYLYIYIYIIYIYMNRLNPM
jgi:hypothetical protein